MPRCHPPRLPRLWLLTDERSGDALWGALARLPRGAGVVFRHHATPPRERRALLRRVAHVARARRLLLVVAGDTHGVRAAGRHGGCRGNRRGVLTRSVHDPREAVAARRARADLAFVSPVFATRSHPGARVLGRSRLGLLLRRLTMPAIALGGMDAPRARALAPLGIHGWAAIDAWMKKGPGLSPRPSRVSAGGTPIGARRQERDPPRP